MAGFIKGVSQDQTTLFLERFEVPPANLPTASTLPAQSSQGGLLQASPKADCREGPSCRGVGRHPNRYLIVPGLRSVAARKAYPFLVT